MTKHPAKFSPVILDHIRTILDDHQFTGRILDPFAGTGRVHELRTPERYTVGVELEPEWAQMHPDTIVGNALQLPFPDHSFDAIVTSPCYGNRMADCHVAKDASVRNTYTHTLGRKLHRTNAGAMQWENDHRGDDYRILHAAAWWEVARVIKAGLYSKGLVILNISNHPRRGVEQRVMEWHLEHLIGYVGLYLVSIDTVDTPRLRHGANGNLRTAHEYIITLRTPT